MIIFQQQHPLKFSPSVPRLCSCRLKAPAYYAAFLCPIGLIVATNTIILIKCIFTLNSQDSEQLRRFSPGQATAKRVKGALGLTFLLGVTWLLGIPMMDEAKLAFQYIFALLNTLQGVAIFLFQILLNREIRRSIATSLSSIRYSRTSIGSAQTTVTFFSTLTRTLQRQDRSGTLSVGSNTGPSSTVSTLTRSLPRQAESVTEPSSPISTLARTFRNVRQARFTPNTLLSPEEQSNWLLMTPQTSSTG